MNVCAAAYLHLKCVETNCSNCMKQSQYNTISSNTTCFQMQSSNPPLIHIPLAGSQLEEKPRNPEHPGLSYSMTLRMRHITQCLALGHSWIYIHIIIYLSWCFLVHSTFPSFQHLPTSKAMGTAATQRPKGIPKGFTWKTVLIAPCTSRQSWSWWKQLCGFFDVDAVLLQDIVSHYVLCCHVYGYMSKWFYDSICLYVYMSRSLCLSLSLSLSRPLRCHVASCGHVSYDLFFWGFCADRNGKSWDVMYKYLIKRNSPHDSRLLSSSAQYSAHIPQIRAVTVSVFLFSWHLNMILNFSYAAVKTNAKHASPQHHKRQAKARANFPWAAPAAGEDPLQRIRFWSLYEYFVCFLNVFR